jgi:hypothetical protein
MINTFTGKSCASACPSIPKLGEPYTSVFVLTTTLSPENLSPIYPSQKHQKAKRFVNIRTEHVTNLKNGNQRRF